MAMLHDPAVRENIETRLNSLRPDSKARWGRMTVSQMLWHVNQAMAGNLGQTTLDESKIPIPRPVVKFIVLNLPWSKNAPTNKALIAKDEHNFHEQLARCRKLIAETTASSLSSPDLQHPTFGRMTPRDCSRLTAKHLDHHLKQFGVD